MRIVPITLRDACAFIARHHRHNKPPRGWKFGVGLQAPPGLVGVATAGRPVAKEIQNREPLTIEVNRTCTDGTRNANSALYGAIWRAARAMGYTRAITYIQGEESGASLRAAGWVKVCDLPPAPGWDRPGRPRGDIGSGHKPRQLWEIRCGTTTKDTRP